MHKCTGEDKGIENWIVLENTLNLEMHAQVNYKKYYIQYKININKWLCMSE